MWCIDAINKQENEILKSDKPVKVSKPDEATVILTPQEAVRQANTSAKKRESFPVGFFNKSKTARIRCLLQSRFVLAQVM